MKIRNEMKKGLGDFMQVSCFVFRGFLCQRFLKFFFLAYFVRILNSCVVYKFQTVNPGCLPSQPHAFRSTAFDETFAQSCVFAVVNSADVALCVLLLCFNVLPVIFPL